jgi:hypothetical protein
MRKRTNAPCGEKEIEHPKEEKGTWGDEENKQLRCSAEEHQQQGRANQRDSRGKEERRATTVATSEMSEPGEQCGEQCGT